MELNQERGEEDDEQTWLHTPELPSTRSMVLFSLSLWTPLFSPGKWVLYLSYRVSITIRGEIVCTPVHMHLHIHVYEIALSARAKEVCTTQVSVEGQGTGNLQQLPTVTPLNIPKKAVLTDACRDVCSKKKASH